MYAGKYCYLCTRVEGRSFIIRAERAPLRKQGDESLRKDTYTSVIMCIFGALNTHAHTRTGRLHHVRAPFPSPRNTWPSLALAALSVEGWLPPEPLEAVRTLKLTSETTAFRFTNELCNGSVFSKQLGNEISLYFSLPYTESPVKMYSKKE